MKQSGKASAPAKIILFGEHFVVHGNPAILASINRRIQAKARLTDDGKIVINSDIGVSGTYTEDGKLLDRKEILDPIYKSIQAVLQKRKSDAGIKMELKSKIPIGIGLGSSAACCVSAVAAADSLFGKPDRMWVCENAIEAERLIHKNSSGADCYVSTFGGLIYYSKNEGFKKLKSKKTLNFIIGNTGIKHSTGALVSAVEKFKGANELMFRAIAAEAADICNSAFDAIKAGDEKKVGTLMNENQALLRQLGVSHGKVEDMVEICNRAGALGAKMTGAGGGGAVIALASAMDRKKISSAISKSGYGCFEAQIDYDGLVL